METKISLALACKLKLLFETEDKFLTFPLGLGFPRRFLGFMQDGARSGLSPQEQLNNRAEFARLFNIIPDDSSLFVSDASRLLWDELIGILQATVFAESALTPQETDLLAKAIAFLRVEVYEEGTLVSSGYTPAVKKYYEFKTVYEEAVRRYLNEKMTVEYTAGPEGEALRQQWDAYREKELRELRAQAERDWLDQGFKKEVEYYQALRNSLEPKKYLELYRRDYLEDLEFSEFEDLNSPGVPVYTTFFSPADAFAPAAPWPELQLTRQEMNALVQNAPGELKAIFNGGQGGDDIELLSLEYNNIVVIRPWFKPEFFQSRYWKLPDGAVVSDGNLPRRGKIPAYITSLVVARNITVARKKTADLKPPPILPILGKLPLDKLKAGLQVVRAARPDIRALLGDRNVLAAPAAAAKIARPPAAPLAPNSLPPDLRTLRDMRRKTPTAKLHYLAGKYNGLTINTPERRLAARLPGALAADPELTTENYSLDGVVVLACLCKRLPKAPDPDSGLNW